jgi:hypothetical protein
MWQEPAESAEGGIVPFVEFDDGPPPRRIVPAYPSGEVSPYEAVPDETLLKAVTSRDYGAPAGSKHAMVASARRYFFAHQGIWEDGTPHLDFRILRAIGYRNPILWLILNHLINRVSAHFVRPPNERAIGVKVVQKERWKPLTEGAAKRIKYIENVLFNGGVIRENPKTGEPAAWDLEFQFTADRLQDAVRKMVRDSLVLDQAFISVEGHGKYGGRARDPVMYWKVEDGSLARKVDRDRYQPKFRPQLAGKIKHVMIDPSLGRWSVMREYLWNEGFMFHRNPRTDWGSFGYGKSEVEQALDVIMGVLYGMNANKEWFTDNHIPHGVLYVVGQFGPNEIQQLRLRLKQEVGGLGRYWGMPIVHSLPGAGSNMQYVPFNPRQDFGMVSEQWITFCVAVFSGIFGTAPEEVGFGSFGGPDQTLQQPDPESTFAQSQHRGEIPKVLWVAESLDQAVVQQIDPDFTLTVQGIETSYIAQDTARATLDNQRQVNGYTINDIHALNDEPPQFDPQDLELWDKVRKGFEGKWFASERVRIQAMIDDYVKHGGKKGSCYDAPVGNAGAMEIWMAEHMQQQQDAQEQMNQMAAGETDHQRAGEQAEADTARQQMGELGQREDERQAIQQQQNDADQQGGVMRVPGVGDAGELRKSVRPRKLVRLGKLLIPAPRR